MNYWTPLSSCMAALGLVTLVNITGIHSSEAQNVLPETTSYSFLRCSQMTDGTRPFTYHYTNVFSTSSRSPDRRHEFQTMIRATTSIPNQDTVSCSDMRFVSRDAALQASDRYIADLRMSTTERWTFNGPLRWPR